jgi:hypothetical protein
MNARDVCARHVKTACELCMGFLDALGVSAGVAVSVLGVGALAAGVLGVHRHTQKWRKGCVPRDDSKLAEAEGAKGIVEISLADVEVCLPMQRTASQCIIQVCLRWGLIYGVRFETERKGRVRRRGELH